MAKVLMIDDDPDFGDWADAILCRRGHEVQVTTSARFVTEPRNEHASAFDVALIDMNMPEIDGIEAIQAMKKLCPSAKVVAISGGGPLCAANFYLRWARSFGADDALTKPFTCDNLCDAIERVLHSRLATKHDSGAA